MGRSDWPVTCLFTAGFLNLAVIAGPGSPSLLSNVLLSIEEHVDWVAGLLDEMRARGADVVEATGDAEQRWVDHVNERAQATLYAAARSCYKGDEVPGKPRVFMPYVGGVCGYRRVLEGVVADGYAGLELRPAGDVSRRRRAGGSPADSARRGTPPSRPGTGCRGEHLADRPRSTMAAGSDGHGPVPCGRSIPRPPR